MAASQNQSTFNAVPPGTTFGAKDTVSEHKATPAMSVGSATAAGHGQHPKDKGDDSNATLSSSRIGPQNEDLEGEQMRMPGEGDVMNAQFEKKNAGWGEQESMTSDLNRMKEEQRKARRAVTAARNGGANVDGGIQRLGNEGVGEA